MGLRNRSRKETWQYGSKCQSVFAAMSTQRFDIHRNGWLTVVHRAHYGEATLACQKKFTSG
jgi:hypothetical protein